MPNHLVVDSSVLIFFERKSRLEEFLQQKKKENYEVVIPEAIAQEVIEEPRAYAEKIRDTAPELASKILDSVEKINRAIQQGLVRVETVNYRRYSKVMDNVRKHLSKIEAKPEYAVKKGDPEIVALILQLSDETKGKVCVATLDKGLLKMLARFSAEVDYEVLRDP